MKMPKITFLAMLVLAIAAQAFASENRPNILFFFIDDSGWGDFSCYGNPVKTKQGGPITPNIDRLASEGIRFTQGYVASPICSPSRTAVLTGIEPARYAIYSFLNDRASNASRNMANWVQPDTVAAPRLFKQAGYLTGQFGKWHMGNGRDVNDAPPPSAYGFDQSLVAFEGNGDRLGYWNDDGTKYGLSVQNEDATLGTYEYMFWYQAAGRHTDRALAFMTNAVQAGKPFYMHVPYNDTHSPYNVPPGQANDFDHITGDTTGKLFLGELHNLDKQIGRVIDAVDGLGIATNTLIVLVGDNGAPNDALETLLNRNGGLRGGKGNIYEGGIRVAWIVRCPGLVPAGVVNSTTAISTVDLLPTYCSLAGIPLPNAPFAGEDMSDVFQGSTRARVRPLFWEYGTVSGLNPASPKLAIRRGPYKFMRDPDGTDRTLYLLPEDHAESENVVYQPDHAETVAELEAELMTWYDQHVLGNMGETYPCSNPAFIGEVLSDDYNVPGGESLSSGFGFGSGVNFDVPGRLTGAAAGSLYGYRLGTAGGTSPRQPSDFSISGNRLAVAPRLGNARFEFSPDGVQPFNFGPYLAGRTYELSISMNIDAINGSSQRMSLGLSDASDAAVGEVDLGVQIGSDGAGGLAVFKRLDAASAGTANDVNTRISSGHPIGTPIEVMLRVTDYNVNTTDFASSFEILINGTVVNTGAFRFNASNSARYIVFDIAAQVDFAHYDDFSLVVTEDNSVPMVCRKPRLSLSEITSAGPGATNVRLFWTAQPGLTVWPEYSTDLVNWQPLTDGPGHLPMIATPHGSIQWFNPTLPTTPNTFFRLRKE